MGTAAIVLVFLSLIWLLMVFVRRNDKPLRQNHGYRSVLTQGQQTQDCETCNRAGTIRLDRPWIKLSFAEQMSSTNQLDCPCCGTMGFHWIQKGGKYRCLRYEEGRCSVGDIRRNIRNGRR
jgi:hypothetical protein